MWESRPGSALFGVPAMVAVFAFLAFAGQNILVAFAGAVIVLLVIGFAMAVAKKSG
jgi:hypothetical protein